MRPLKVRACAILETMWGSPVERRAPRWFQINRDNHTGRRLYWLLGHEDLLVTNACPQYVATAKHHGKPDPAWLAENLQRIECGLLLVCGSVAYNTFIACGAVPTWRRVMHIKHPAWRGWTKEALSQLQQQIRADIH
jgi:hypothetical protein